MAFSFLISDRAQSSNNSTVSTTGVDTTGAKLIVVNATMFTGSTTGTVTDNYNNNWISTTPRTVGGDGTGRLFYSFNPIVGANHIFSLNGTAACYPSIGMMAFSYSGSDLLMFNVESGNAAGGTSPMLTGSILPTFNNALIISTFWESFFAGSVTADASTTVMPHQTCINATSYGHCEAYKIQTTAASIQVSWSFTGSGNKGVEIAAFTPITLGRVGNLFLDDLSTVNPLHYSIGVNGNTQNKVYDTSDFISISNGDWQRMSLFAISGLGSNRVFDTSDFLDVSNGNWQRYSTNAISGATTPTVAYRQFWSRSQSFIQYAGTYKITGRTVINGNTGYQTYVVLTLFNSPAVVFSGGYTDADGYFTFDWLLPGKYTVIAYDFYRGKNILGYYNITAVPR